MELESVQKLVCKTALENTEELHSLPIFIKKNDCASRDRIDYDINKGPSHCNLKYMAGGELFEEVVGMAGVSVPHIFQRFL